MERRRMLVAVAVVAAAVAALAVAVLATGEGRAPGDPILTGPIAMGVVVPPPPPPPWGDFAGAPPDLAAPVGGDVVVTPAGSGDGLTVVVRRADGSTLARAEADASGTYLGAEYLDRAGRLTVAVDAVRAAGPAASGPGARVRCGSGVRRAAGYRWTRFPVGWRLNAQGLARGLRAPSVLAAIRRARATWGGNRSHCRLPDRSRAGFAFRGTAGRRTARDGVSVVEFGRVARLGGLCAETVACTVTWVLGGRATESDTRLERGRAFSSGRRRARAFDLESVMVHESGHTLGFAHVAARDNVMHAFLRRGTTAGRRLGRGDALQNNARY